MRGSEMVLLRTALAVCVTCAAAVQSFNFPPVQYRPPTPADAVRRSLYDQNLMYSAAQRLPGYPTQRWIFPPNVILTQVSSDNDGSISTESSTLTQVSENDNLPQQVGAVATPPPDSVAHENPIDLPPEYPSEPLPNSVNDRAGFIPDVPITAGKSQRGPDGLPAQPLTYYRVYNWEPILLPEDVQSSTATTPVPVSLPITDPATTTKSPGFSNPIWLSAPTADLSGISFAQVTNSRKSDKVIPIQQIVPTPSKGYALDNIVRSPRGQKGIPLGALNLYPRARYIMPDLGPVQVSDPYTNGYIAALTGYNPPPPDRVRDNSNAGTVTLTNAYGDMWVLKRDGPRSYFEKVKLGIPSSTKYGTS